MIRKLATQQAVTSYLDSCAEENHQISASNVKCEEKVAVNIRVTSVDVLFCS